MFKQGSDRNFAMAIGLTDLPEELLEMIAKFLSPKDLVSFSHVNSRIYNFFNKNVVVWKSALEKTKYKYVEVREIARNVIESKKSIVNNVEKLSVMMHLSLKKSWENVNFRLASIFPTVRIPFPVDQHHLRIVVPAQARPILTFNTFDVSTGRHEEVAWNTDLGVQVGKDEKQVCIRVVAFKSTIFALFEEPVYVATCFLYGLDFSKGASEVTDLWQTPLTFKTSLFRLKRFADQLFIFKSDGGIEAYDSRTGNRTFTYEKFGNRVLRNKVCFDGDWLIVVCGRRSPGSDPTHRDFIPPGETRVAAVNFVESRHKFLQPTQTKYVARDFSDFETKDQKVVGLFRDGQVNVWDLSTGTILYSFNSTLPNSHPGYGCSVYSFDPSRDEIIFSRCFSPSSSSQKELMVWKTASQSDRLCDVQISFLDLITFTGRQVDNVAFVCFGQFVRAQRPNRPIISAPLLITSLEDPQRAGPTMLDFEIDYVDNVSHTPSLIVVKNAHSTIINNFLHLEQFLFTT